MTHVRVTFKGLVTHFLGNNVQRAVVLKTMSHKATILFPGALKNEIKAAFPNATCGTDCEVILKDVGFRIVDSGGTPGTAFSPSPTFDRVVTHLQRVPNAGDTFDQGNIESDVFTPKSGSQVVAGYFELAGAKDTVEAFNCKGKFHSQGSGMDFPHKVHMDFDVSGDARLETQAAGASGWTLVATLPAGSSFTFFVTNDTANAVSHFDEFARFSKKRDGSGNPIDLENVEKVNPRDQCTSGDIPGCSNSQWP